MKFKLFGISFFLSYPAVAFLTIALLSDKNGSLFLCVLASLIHESGHIMMMLLLKVKILKINVNLEDVAIIADSHNLSFRSEVLVSFSGVLFNVVFVAVFGVLYIIWRTDIFFHLLMANLCVAVFNVLPIKYLDGGQLLALILSNRLDYRLTDLICNIITFVFLLPLAGIGFVFLFNSRYNYSLLFAVLYLICTLVSKEFKNVS